MLDLTRALSGPYATRMLSDLGAEGAADLILDLALVADVLVENVRPGVMERHGLGWSRLHELNPKLIMLSISGFGQDGPERGVGQQIDLSMINAQFYHDDFCR